MKREQRHGFWQAAPQCSPGGLGLALLTVVCYRLRVNLTTVALLYMIVVLMVNTTRPLGWSARPAAVVPPRR